MAASRRRAAQCASFVSRSCRAERCKCKALVADEEKRQSGPNLRSRLSFLFVVVRSGAIARAHSGRMREYLTLRLVENHKLILLELLETSTTAMVPKTTLGAHSLHIA